MKKPKKGRRKVVALVLGAAFAVLGIVFLASPTPTHQGKTAEEWIDKLYLRKNYAEAAEAVQALQSIGAPAVRPLLLCAGSSLSGGELYVDKALKAIGEPGVEPLVRWLEESDGRFRKWKRRLWFRLPRWMQQRIRCPEDGREAAQRAYPLLAAMGPANEKAVEALLQGLEHEDYRCRTLAINLLPLMDRVHAERIVSALMGFLSDPNSLESVVAARMLAHFGVHAAPATSRLIELLQYEDGLPESRFLRMAAADALRNIGDGSAPVIDALARGLQEEIVTCRAYCALALWRLGKERPSALRVLEESLDANHVAADLTRILNRLARWETDDKPPLEGRLESLLTHRDLRIRIYAAGCLWTISQSSARAMPVLLDALENGNDDQKKLAADRLAWMGEAGSEAVPLLIRTVKIQPAARAKYDAVRALGEMGMAMADAQPAPRAKYSAIKALGKMGIAAADAIPVLRENLSHPSAQAQILAYEAIEAIRAAIKPPGSLD